MIKIDLHIHSNFSDGEDSPETIVESCKALGLELISLTDHDTIDGIAPFLKRACEVGINAISGIELSSELHKEIHILGYNVQYDDPVFLKKLSELKGMRDDRNKKILEQLRKYKVFLCEKDITSISGETIGRMHIAKAMKQKGYVSSIGEAFDRYLAHGKKAYVRSCRIAPEEAIGIIRAAGGYPVLAHPYKLMLGEREMAALAEKLVDRGLAGLEVYYTGHTEKQTAYLKQLAEKLGIFATCGSDYHGKLRANSLGGVTPKTQLELPFRK